MFKKAFLVMMILCSVIISNKGMQAKDNSIKEVPAFKVGVNRFAWYSALQIINFMPMISADPFSGVILSDWYSINDKERYKIDVYILEEVLSAETVEVRVFKQAKINGAWVDISVKPELSTQIENAILNTARQLRVEGVLSSK